MASDLINVERGFLEHLLNCLANQKFINEINADATTCDYKRIIRETQQAIDQAWLQGMEIINDKRPT